MKTVKSYYQLIFDPITGTKVACRWGPWFNTDTNPSGKGDHEMWAEIVKTYGSQVFFLFRIPKILYHIYFIAV